MATSFVGPAFARCRDAAVEQSRVLFSRTGQPIQRKILRLPPARNIVVGDDMSKLIREPIRPYWLAFFLVLAGIVVETATAIAEARPLKTIVDNLASNHHLPKLLPDFVGPLPGGTSKMCVAAIAALLLVAIGVASAIAGRWSTARGTVRVIRINGGLSAVQSPAAHLNSARLETKAALAA
jgi:hypothetical protein